MIKRISCQAIVEGKKFNPHIIPIPKSLRVIEKFKNGDLINFGRNKDKPSLDGLLIVDGDIDGVVKFITSDILSIYEREMVELNLCVLVQYEGECNFELTQEQLNIITTLKVPLAISCYSESAAP